MIVSLLTRWHSHPFWDMPLRSSTTAFQIIDIAQQMIQVHHASTFSTTKLYGRQRGARKNDNDVEDDGNLNAITSISVKGTKTTKKEHLPSKICVICNRPFTWRKKWERCWDEVTTCSKKCNSERRTKK
jgi:hypothetical protein